MTPAADAVDSSSRAHSCAGPPSGRSAVGSAPGLGPGGREFESLRPDLEIVGNWGRERISVVLQRKSLSSILFHVCFTRPSFGPLTYTFSMTVDDNPTEPLAPTHRWQLFEQLCGEKVRASDAAWVHGLLPAERVAVADELFVTVRAARVAAGDWQQVDARAWQETLSDRIQQVRAFRRYDEALRGTSSLADAG